MRYIHTLRDLWLATDASSGDDASDIPLGIAEFSPSRTYIPIWCLRFRLFAYLILATHFYGPIVESSTFHSLDSQFSVDYGQGSAQGTLGQDKVQMAGFEVEDQAFGSSLFFFL